jgi:Leucine-rich repeat (LRR) protein
MTLTAGGTHTVAAPATLNIASFARLIVPDMTTFTNNGTINVGGAATLEIQGNGIVNGANDVTYSVTNAVLEYTGSVAKLPTGREFPNAMGGSVNVANTAGVTQLTGTTKTVAGTFTLVGAGAYSINGMTGNSLILNGPLVNSAAGYFQSNANNFTINNTVTGNLRFGPTVAEWGLNNLTINSPSAITLGNNLDVANQLSITMGSLATGAFTLGLTGGATHGIAAGAALNVGAGGRLIVSPTATITNNGAMGVAGTGTLEIQNNGIVTGANTVAYAAATAVLQYTGTALKNPTTNEFPDAMGGSVLVQNTARVLLPTAPPTITKTVAGTFTMNANGLFSMNGNNNSLVFNGPLTVNAGSFFESSANNSMTFGSAMPSNISFGAPWEQLNNLTITGAGNLTLTSPIAVLAGTLTLGAGGGNIISTPTNVITVTNTAPGAVVRTTGFIDGPLNRAMTGAGTYDFPTGKGAQYLPFSITNPSGGTVSVEAFTGNAGAAAGAGMGTPSTTEYWRTQTLSGTWSAGGQVILQPITAPTTGQVVGRFDGTVPAGTYLGIGGSVAGATITSTVLTPPVPATSMFFLRSTSLPLPTTATSIAFTTVNTTDFSGSFTAASPVPAGYLVVRRPAASVGTTPTNGTGYLVGNTIGSGTVIAVGAGTAFSSTGLVPSTSYAVDVYSFNGAGASIVYSASQLSGTVTTLSGAVPCTTGTITLPVTRYVLERNMQFTALSFGGAGVLSGAGTNTAYVNPGGTFTLSYTYNATPAGAYCPGCVTQIYLGINGVFTHCIATHVPQTSSGSGVTASISAPATPGIYYVALNGSWDYSCYGTVGFSTNPVDAIATLIVGAPCQSNASDMVQPAFAYPAPISYVSNTNGIVNVGNPSVWKLQVRDGGGGTDADFLPTVVTGMTINITDANNVLDRVALYDAAGTTKLGEIVAAPTITFSGLDGPWGPFVTAPDGGTVDFILKATYKTSPVLDNSFFTFTVTSVTARSDRSGMGGFAAQGPSLATGSNNHVDVVADRPTWTGFGAVQPTTVGLNPLFVSPAPVVAGVDVNGNFDSGYTGTIQVSNPPSLVGGPLNISAVGGLATYTGASSVRHTTNGTMQLTARIGPNTAVSNSFTVSSALLSAAPTTLNFGNVAVGDYVEQSFTLNGSTLPSNGILQYSATPFADISISATGGGAFTTVASIALNPTPAAPSSPGGSTLTQTFYVRYKPAANTTMSGQIIATFPGSVSMVVPIQGQGIATTVTTSTLALNFGSVFVGGSSDQLYSVSAKNISGPLTLTASAGVTISSTGTAPFWTSFPLTPIGNQITTQLITARFTPTLYGTTVMGTITHTNPFTTATIVSWQGMGSNPIPVALGFASSSENSSTATGGVPGGVLDATSFAVQAASFRADGVIANVSTASLQLQVTPLPGGTATFSLSGGTATFSAASRITLPNVSITWTNAPLAGGVTQAIITLVRTSGDVLQSTQAIISINKGPVIPTITSISPLIIGSGSTVTISGTNFFSSTTVTFGGVPAASFIINSSSLITAVAGASGASGDVEVRAPGGIARTRTVGNSTDTLRFFGPPTITDFNPKEGKAGDIISIQGTNFDPSAFAFFGGVQAGSATVNNTTLMNASLTANGDDGLVVVRSIGGTTTSTVAFSFVRPPDIQGLGTRFGTLGTEIIVTGANFKSIQEVWLGPIQVTLATVTVDSPQQLRFRVPAAVSGAITVRNLAGVSVSNDVFTYVFPPQITSMTPDSGSLGNQVIIRGQNFILVTSVTIAGAAPLQTFVVSTTQIVAVLGRGETSTAPVIVQTIGGVTVSTLRFTFINPPTISSIRPLVGGPRTMLTITGANFSAIERITVGGLDVRSYEVISTTQIVAVVSDAGGSGNVQVFNRLGGAFSSDRFTFYFPPNVQNFDPIEGSTGSTITIIGENFVNSTTTVVTIGGIPVTEFEVPLASQIIAVVSTGATGKVGVRTDGGYSESVMTFRFVPPKQVPPPRITGFAPDSASVGELITVDGLNFVNVRQVRVSGITVASFTVTSPTSLSFLLPQVSTGTIEVQTTTGTATARRELLVIPPRVQLTPLQRDSITAVQIYNANGGADWTRRSNWLTNATINRWQGITVENGRITQITLDSAGLRGVLPIGISNLTALKTLRLRGNSLEGSFPSGILLLPQLQELALSNNQFSGEIPSGIGSLVGLTSLRLDGNRFTGQIPSELCSLIGLKEIVLANNQLIGTIPTCFARIPVLERLDLSNNRFVGGIPTEFAALPLLQDLLVNNNLLTSPIPRTIWGSVNSAIAAQKNEAQITATGLRSLTRLNISNNQIIGEIPTEIVNATALQEFTASNNQLSGSLPSALGTLVNLRILDVSNNSLTGQIPTSIRDLRLAERFAVSRNGLSGTIPLEVGQMVNLRVLALDSNTFSGAAPEALAVLARLQILRLQSNQFTAIPNLSALQSLTILAVENNRLQFETLEPNVRSSTTSFAFTYSPQDSVGVARDTAAAVGLPFVLSSRLLSENNVHTWFKNGREVPGVLGRALTFPAFARLDTGVYSARVTNSVVRGLTLVTRPVRVSASTAPVPAGPPALLAPTNQAVSVSLNATFEWLSVVAATSYDLQIAPDATFNAPILDTTLSSTQVRLLAGTLKSFTGYVWRVRARNESGVSAWSEVRTFTTIDAGALVIVPSTDIGRSVVGRTKSGNVEITSVSDVPVQLVGARLEGTDIAAFRIDTSTTSVRDVTIPAFGKYQIRINFNPASLGVKQVRLVLTLSNGGTTTTERSGTVRGTPTFVDVNNLIFDTVLTNFAKVRNLAIANFGRDTIRIRERLQFSDTNAATAVFKLDPAAPQFPYTIRPGDTLYLPVQALSSRLGETSGTISIITAQDTIVVSTKAFIREKNEQDVSFSVGITTSTTSAAPGSRVFLTMYIIPQKPNSLAKTIDDINRAGNPSFVVSLSMDYNVLIPIGTETKLIPQSISGKYRISQQSMELNATNPTFLKFECIAVAGQTNTTDIEITERTWNAPNIFVGTTKGTFTANVSRAGGLRLIAPATKTAKNLITALKPNPSSDETVVAYTVQQDETLEIAVFDARGAKVRTLLAATDQKAGHYTITLRTSDLASGQYRIMLIAPSGMVQEQLNVVR